MEKEYTFDVEGEIGKSNVSCEDAWRNAFLMYEVKELRSNHARCMTIIKNMNGNACDISGSGSIFGNSCSFPCDPCNTPCDPCSNHCDLCNTHCGPRGPKGTDITIQGLGTNGSMLIVNPNTKGGIIE